MLVTKDLVKIYKPKKGVPVTALNKVNLTFPEKGMVFLLGKSGSGKSTLLNVLGGLDSYDSGEIIIKGVSSKEFRQKHFDSYRNTYIGFIFQEYNVLDEFTVGANIALAIELQNRKASDREINDILKTVDLEGFGSRKPNELSGGQKQRVAIARALVKNPQIIMADEPTGALDSNTGKQVFDTLKSLSKDKLVIVVSHDREFAEKYADRIIELSDGVVVSDVELSDAFAESPENEGITYNGNTIELPEYYHLTEQDRIDINSYIDALKGGKVSLSLSKGANLSSRFTETDESKIRFSDASPFKLIQSKLPMKSSFKIGASGLKFKKIRLIVTILLSCISFGLFGLADTFGAYNHIDACTNSLMDTGVKYIATCKSKKTGEGSRTFWRDYGYRLSETDLEKMQKEAGINMHGVYIPLNTDLTYLDQVDSEAKFSETDMNIYDTTFSGFAEMDDKIAADMGFKLIAGKMPDGNKNEIAVSNYVYEVFKIGKYTDGSTSKDKDGNEIVNYETISTPSDLLGKVLFLNDTKYTISGVIDTGFDLERYKPVTKADEHPSNLQNLVNYALYDEFSTSHYYSFTSAIMVGKENMEKLLNERVKASPTTEGYVYMLSDADNGNIDPQYVSTLPNVQDEKIVWVDGEKTTLAENEVIVTTDVIMPYEGEFKVNSQAGVEKLKEFLKKNTFTTTIYDFTNEKDQNFKKCKVVGFINTEDEKNKTKFAQTLICSEKMFSLLSEGVDNYYDFCVGAAPQGKKELHDLVAYCYREDSNIRYQIQNSVTFELDTINELLQQLSKVFLYVGIGFALFAALMLSNFIGTSISYKKQEIGILRAIGARSNDVFRIFFSESFIIAMINFVLSSLGVFAVTVILNHLTRYDVGILITILHFGARQLILLFAVSLLVAFAASFIPVKQIASKKPIDAIRDR